MKYLITLIFLVSCSDPLPTSAQKGKAIYQAKCISCHNVNPSLPGSHGPDLKGSSFDLINSKLLTRDYPPGYKPKRQTKMMPKIIISYEDTKFLTEYLENIN